MGKAIVLIILTLTTAVFANNVNQTALEALPDCVKQCSDLVLPIFSCTPSNACFCDDNLLQEEMTQCITSRCTFPEGLAAQKFRANTCGLPAPDRGLLLSVVSYTLFGIAAVFTFMRALSRYPGLGGAGYRWDDLVAFLAFVPLAGLTAGDYFAISNGEGRAIWTLELFQIRNFLMWFYICNILYTVAIFATKISLVLLYLRIWPGKHLDAFRGACWATLFGLASTLIAFTVVCIFQCTPIPYIWHRVDGAHGSCIDLVAWVWALAVVEIVFDFIVILLPVPKLLKLNITAKRKIGICSVFLVGFAVTACSLVRLKYIHGFATNPNFTYYYSYIGIWSSIEAYLSQACCCMPAMTGLLGRTWMHVVGPSFGISINSSADFGSTQRGFTVMVPKRTTADDEEKRTSNESEFYGAATAPDVPRHPSHTGSSQARTSQTAISQTRTSQTAISQTRTSQTALSQKGIVSVPPTISHHTQNRRSNPPSRPASMPDVMYHDRRNQLKLSIYDPPDERPVNAQLQYVDRDDNFHDVELQGASPEPIDRGSKDRTPTLDLDMLPITKPKRSADPLRDQNEQLPRWI